MTDHDLLLSLAALMGWQEETRLGNLSETDEVRYFPAPDGDILIGVAKPAAELNGKQWYYRSFRPWRPLDSMDDALTIVDRLRTREDGDRYWCEMRTPWMDGDQEYRAGFSLWGFTGWNGRPDYSAAASSLARAVCLAALLIGRGAGE